MLETKSKTKVHWVSKKMWMSVSGLFLVLFLFVHLSGNLLLYKGEAVFNAYAHFMATNPFIRITEILLFLAFLVHIVFAIQVTIASIKARPIRYQIYRPSANSTVFSRTMALSGIVLLLFLLIHLRTFFYESRIGGQENLYQLVKEAFSNPWYSAFYVFCFVFLGSHLAHGVFSGPQTLGIIFNKRWDRIIRTLAYLIAITVPALYASIPIYFLLSSMGK
jgi:succinate dehydrogenase / fumarate reductase cytochrome b subunit